MKWRGGELRPLSAAAARPGQFLVVVCSAVTLVASAAAQVPGRCELPASQRPGDIGCYVSTTVVLGELPTAALFWHVYRFPDRAAAASVAGPMMTVVEVFGRIWLYAIADEGLHLSSGERVAVVGPLPVEPGKRYTAHYVEAVFPPGMSTSVHRHPGPEASYVIAGAECVETPNGKVVTRAGEGAVIPEGVPMQLHNPGPEVRQAIAVILHDTAHHWSIPVRGWTPEGLCRE
jgi:quercetin dioxygenase-like cupin family protein